MESIVILADLLCELQESEQYVAATTVGIRLREQIYLLAAKEKQNAIQPVQPQQA